MARILRLIGSRRTSHYGAECAKKLSYQLAYSGLTVISGLARGIDTAAHQGALAAKGRTIAVIDIVEGQAREQKMVTVSAADHLLAEAPEALPLKKSRATIAATLRR